MLNYYTYQSPLGTLHLYAEKSLLVGIYFTNEKKIKLQTSPILEEAIKQLDEYFNHQRTIFNLPLKIDGTPFQKKVWSSLKTIPYGKTISYGELALKIKNAKAFRAVGTANGKNPFPIIIPCHRVIKSDGTIGGYAGGVAIKKHLLNLEKR